jgi:hypothetical protein
MKKDVMVGQAVLRYQSHQCALLDSLRTHMANSPKRDNETQSSYVIRLIQEEERERCAKIAENWAYPPVETASGIAAAIRKQVS